MELAIARVQVGKRGTQQHCQSDLRRRGKVKEVLGSNELVCVIKRGKLSQLYSGKPVF